MKITVNPTRHSHRILGNQMTHTLAPYQHTKSHRSKIRLIEREITTTSKYINVQRRLDHNLKWLKKAKHDIGKEELKESDNSISQAIQEIKRGESNVSGNLFKIFMKIMK